MGDVETPDLRGSCLCGAVQLQLTEWPKRLTHCHCRMCQKQYGAAFASFPTVVQQLADFGADIHVWTQPNEQGRTPLFIAEGFRGGLPRPSRATIEAVTFLMDGAGISTAGPRPELIDQYSLPAQQPQPPAQPDKPEKQEKSEQGAKAQPQVR